MKAFKFRCFPNEAQQQMLQKTFGSCRFVWNKLVAENSTRDKISITELSNQFFKLKTNQEFYWLAEPPAVALQQTLVILANAFYQLRKAPKFKSKTRDKNSFRVVGNYAIRIKNRKLIGLEIYGVNLPVIQYLNLKMENIGYLFFVKSLNLT